MDEGASERERERERERFKVFCMHTRTCTFDCIHTDLSRHCGSA